MDKEESLSETLIKQQNALHQQNKIVGYEVLNGNSEINDIIMRSLD
ncbi:hypothetical protein [Seinonella peptonophila]|nr:hypothetical protein [Seinonella peptonophila]